MGRKSKSIAIACMVLLFSLSFGSFVSFDVASANPSTALVQWNYYVVAGYNMTPSPPPVPPSPAGFQFTTDPPVYNFGNITYWGGRSYLKEGTPDSPTGSAYVTVNITNLLGYDITVTNLTAEVTAGTPTLHWYFPLADDWFGNYTLVFVDTLDPWNPQTPPELRSYEDEVDYYTGEVTMLATHDGDWVTGAVGTPYPEMPTGPASLLEPDWNGDAELTNHTAPIQLANGSTLTEYFGIIIFGDAEEGTQIDGTITLSLTYEYEGPPPPPAVGGEASPINKMTVKPQQRIPWIWLSTIILSMVATAIYVKHVKRRKKKQ